MLKILLATVCCVHLLVSSGCLAQQTEPVRQQSNEQIEKELRQLENDTFAAIQQKDAKKLEVILADHFVYRDPLQGESSRTAFLAGISALPMKITALWSDEMKVNVYGETAVLTGTQKARIQTGMGKEEVSATAFTDIFVRRNGKWQLVLAHGMELPTAPPGK